MMPGWIITLQALDHFQATDSLITPWNGEVAGDEDERKTTLFRCRKDASDAQTAGLNCFFIVLAVASSCASK